METLINCLSSDTTMDLVNGVGKKRRNTGCISSISCEPKASHIQRVGEAMRQIGGVYGGKAINQRFLIKKKEGEP
jgi:hypothetical protein